MLPWVIALAREPRHHLDAAAAAVLVSVSIPLATLWLAWVGDRNAARSETSAAGSASVFAGHGETAIGPVVVQRRPGVTGKPVRLADTAPFLVGREDLLADLHTRLSAGDDPWPRSVALCGLGGVGKTSVALAYAHRHLAEVSVAWQIPAEDPTVLADGFSQLAAQLGVREVDPRDPVASVHGVLAAFPAEWLLVLDNAPDQATVAEFLPRAGQGRVLITSRDPDWPGRALKVPALVPATAAEFLIARTGDQDQQAALDLAVEMGGLPLALEQAAAYLLAVGGRLADYLDMFRGRRPGLLARGEPIGHRDTVASTFALAFSRLRGEPGAVEMLCLLAFYAPDAIPWRLLLHLPPELSQPVTRRTARTNWLARAHVPWRVALALTPLVEDPLAAGDAIKALHGYSLVTPAGDGTVSLHPLVQAVAQDQMPPKVERQWRRAAAALLEAAIPRDPELPDTWSDCAALLPHAEAALGKDSRGMERLAAYLESSGNYPAARNLQQEVADAREQLLGSEHRRTLIARANVARRTGEAGDAALARDQIAGLLPTFERVFGTKNPNTLLARGDLARWTGVAGDATAARDQYAELAAILERLLGPEHPDTLHLRGHLTHWTGEAGDALAARDQFTELLPVLERALGPDHPDIPAARQQLARWTGEAGNAPAARDQLTELRPTFERIVGPEHPLTLIARRELARWTEKAGDAAAARDQLTELRPAFERVLGAEHPLTLTNRSDIARLNGEAGNAAAARDQFTELLSACERILGPEHWDTLVNRASLARWTGDAGDAAAARDQFAELLSVFDRVFGPEHTAALAVRDRLANWTGEAGDAAAARDQFAELVPVFERVLGPEDPDTLNVRSQLAGWTGEAGNAAAARDQFAELLSACERVCGPEDPITLTVRRHLAHWAEEALRHTGQCAD